MGADPRTVSGDRGQRGRTGLPLGRLEWSGMGDDQHGRAHELSIKIYQHKNFPFEPFEISGKLAPGKPRRTDCAQASADCHVDSPRRPTTPAASTPGASGPCICVFRSGASACACARRRRLSRGDGLGGGGVVRGEPRPDGLHEGRCGVVRHQPRRRFCRAWLLLPQPGAWAARGCR